jgi:hypothetical protein
MSVRTSHGLASHMVSRLPERLPVGATYVVEGFGGDEGNFRVIARYIVLPGGHRINVPADVSSPPAPRAVAFRRRASTKKSEPKTRTASRTKKIARRRGTG